MATELSKGDLLGLLNDEAGAFADFLLTPQTDPDKETLRRRVKFFWESISSPNIEGPLFQSIAQSLVNAKVVTPAARDRVNAKIVPAPAPPASLPPGICYRLRKADKPPEYASADDWIKAFAAGQFVLTKGTEPLAEYLFVTVYGDSLNIASAEVV